MFCANKNKMTKKKHRRRLENVCPIANVVVVVVGVFFWKSQLKQHQLLTELIALISPYVILCGDHRTPLTSNNKNTKNDEKNDSKNISTLTLANSCENLRF